MSALSHLRVLDLSRGVSGSLCTKLMAGFGADVVKVEPLEGDPLRSVGPFAGGRPGPERSLAFLWFNTGKRSLALDAQPESGAELCRRLADRADVVVEDWAPGMFERRGLGWELLRERNPRLVLTSISSFGQSGPRRDWAAEEITLYAMGGLMHSTGDPAREPLTAGPPIAQLSAGMRAYVATLTACYRASATGEGDRVDVSVQEAALDNLEIAIAEYLHLGRIGKRNNDEHALVPWRTYACRDGYAAIVGGPIRHWLRGAEMFGDPELVGERLDHMAKRIENRDEVGRRMAPWLERHDRKEIYHEGQKRGLAFAYLATLDDALESPQHAARGFFVETQHPEVGTQRMVGAPFRPERTPWRQDRAPLLGEHTDPVLRGWLELSDDELGRLRAEGVMS